MKYFIYDHWNLQNLNTTYVYNVTFLPQKFPDLRHFHFFLLGNVVLAIYLTVILLLPFLVPSWVTVTLSLTTMLDSMTSSRFSWDRCRRSRATKGNLRPRLHSRRKWRLWVTREIVMPCDKHKCLRNEWKILAITLCSLCYCEAGKLHVVRGSGVIFLSFDVINTSQRSLYMSTLIQVSIVNSHSPHTGQWGWRQCECYGGRRWGTWAVQGTASYKFKEED